jgi:hypothetical protein
VERKTHIDGRVKTHRGLLKLAFAELRKEHGFIAKMRHLCCQSCAWASIGDQIEKKTGKEATGDENVVFWHQQSESAFKDGGMLSVDRFRAEETRPSSMCLYHSGDAQTVVDVINSYHNFGIQAWWEGDSGRAINVAPVIWCAGCGKGLFGVEPPESWGRVVDLKDESRQLGWLCPSWNCQHHRVKSLGRGGDGHPVWGMNTGKPTKHTPRSRPLHLPLDAEGELVEMLMTT